MLKCVGYSILSLLTRKGYQGYSTYDMWVTHRTSSSYEPDTTKLIFILNQQVH